MSSAMVAGGPHPVQVLFSACENNATRMRSETKAQGEENKRETPLPGFLGILQAASAVVNFEPPWNPARLEQRVGRVHRFGQTQPVQVIHLLTESSIEERVWETLRLKKALFTGLFDEAKDEISFEKLGRKSMMHVIKDVFSEQPGRPKPVLTPEAPQPVAVMEAKRNGKVAAKNGHTLGRSTGTGGQLPADRTMRGAQSPTQDGDARSGLFVPD